MSKPNNGSLTALKFSGELGQFASWKDRVLVHLRSKSSQRLVEELNAKRLKPASRYKDSLTGKPAVAPPKDDATDKEKEGYDLQLAFIDEQESYIKDLLSQTMPASYKLNEKVHQDVHLIWRDIDKRYGLNTVSGVVGLVQHFEAAVTADFKSVSHFFARLKALKDQANRSSNEALQTRIISSNLMMLKILGVLPNHLWGQVINFTPTEFTPDRVEAKLCAIFGNKSKARIMALGNGNAQPVNRVRAGNSKPKKTVLGKRKAEPAPIKDLRYNQGGWLCHYCAGAHNDMGNIGPHKLLECPKRDLDLAAGVKRRDIFSYTSGMPGAPALRPTPKVKGKAKKACDYAGRMPSQGGGRCMQCCAAKATGYSDWIRGPTTKSHGTAFDTGKGHIPV